MEGNEHQQSLSQLRIENDKNGNVTNPINLTSRKFHILEYMFDKKTRINHL